MTTPETRPSWSNAGQTTFYATFGGRIVALLYFEGEGFAQLWSLVMADEPANHFMLGAPPIVVGMNRRDRIDATDVALREATREVQSRLDRQDGASRP